MGGGALNRLKRILAVAASAGLLLACCWVTWSISSFPLYDDPAPSFRLAAWAGRLGLRTLDFLRPLKQEGPTYPVSIALCILFPVCILFALLSHREMPAGAPAPPASPPPLRFGGPARFIGCAAGLVCLGAVLLRVSVRWASAWDTLAWAAALAGVWVAFADGPARGARILGRGEWAVLALASAGVAAFYASGAMWWLYSFCGDEYSYLDMTAHIGSGTLPRGTTPFSQYGVGLGTVPMGISYAQAGIMKLLGVRNFCEDYWNNLAWRLSSTLFATLCLIPLYCYVKHAFSRIAAVAATWLMACSYYLTSWARTGKPHNHVETFYCLALGCYAWFRSAPSRTRMYVSGALLGSGFYFIHSAKFAFVVFLVLYAVDFVRDRAVRKPEYLAAFAAALLVSAAPCFVDPQIAEVIECTRRYALADWVGRVLEEGRAEGTLEFVVRNSANLFLAPFYYSRADHSYMHRTYTDWLTAAFMALGLCWSVVWACRRRRIAALVLSYAAAVLFVGGTMAYNYPSPTRVLWLFPWWAIFAGIGLWRLLALWFPGGGEQGGAWALCLAALLAATGLNLRYTYVMLPTSYPLISPYALIVRQVDGDPSGDRHVYYVGTFAAQGVYDAWASKASRLYGFADRFTVLENKDVSEEEVRDSIEVPALFVVESRNRGAQEVLADLERHFPGRRYEVGDAMGGGIRMHFVYVDESPPGAKRPPPAR